jgi:putative hydrolases of HD superfamily
MIVYRYLLMACDINIDTLLILYNLKDEERRGWVLRGINQPESVADHSWGTALLCLLFAGAEEEAGTHDLAGTHSFSHTAGDTKNAKNGLVLDMEKVLSIAAVHDLAEAVTGDVPTRVHLEEQTVTKQEKQHRERTAMERISAGLDQKGPANTASRCIYTLWQEYEESSSWEARFVRDMNLVDMCLQAFKYQQENRYTPDPHNPHFKHFKKLDEFFETARPRFTTKTGKRLFQQIDQKYRELLRRHP